MDLLYTSRRQQTGLTPKGHLTPIPSSGISSTLRCPSCPPDSLFVDSNQNGEMLARRSGTIMIGGKRLKLAVEEFVTKF
jgi:hypothetical protein